MTAAERHTSARELYEERAAIREFYAGYPRGEAERLGDVIGAGKLRDGIDEHWATHPRSAMQLGMIFDAAKRDSRFQPCIDQMVADGICTKGGQLLKAYRGTSHWETLRRAA